MPSFSHELLVDLCRQRAELARALLRQLGIDPGGAHAEIGSIDLSQVVPTEYRADAVIVFRDEGVARAAAIVEVQLHQDADKRRAWPVYVAALRASLGCPVFLIVIAPDPAVARWARAPIDLGHPGFALTPLVFELPDLPRITDLDTAQRVPELSVLSVLGHPELAVASTALQAITGLTRDRFRLYLDVIMAAVPEGVRRTLEQRIMKNFEYQSEFMRRYHELALATGRAEGVAAGRAEGVAAGRAEGVEVGLQDAVLELARARDAALTAEEESAVRALHDEPRLRALIGTLARAATAEDVRAELRAARATC